MKRIGVIGGMTWESTLVYYQMLNEYVNKQLGDYHSADCLIYNVNFQDIERYQSKGRWDQVDRLLSHAAVVLEGGGAKSIVIASNTGHKVAESIQRHVKIPLLHIVDPLKEALDEAQISEVGLLGTTFTMEDPFYKDRLEAEGFRVIVPDERDRQTVNDVIFDELYKGHITETGKYAVLDIIEKLTAQGAEGIVLGNAGLGRLVKQNDLLAPVFDTAALHTKKAVDLSL
ncbi:aspartate racemase [Scopulibacillus darangshiensis]|uniref:Aspartate racemase n=1 Tax=Scopulibacillus darangshiensis TaxID=442528 RepID=A0A4V2SKJ4_9BACL|nr:aspartate/glutamate racemase family protein [Scopulibacillus darangshiensis]TCP19756.1 aspartate racemase [Scopulibacillus darangshiensis]